MTTKQKEEVAKTLFLTTDKTQKEICEIVGWPEKKFSINKKKEKWGEQRETKSMTKQQIVTELHWQTLKMLEAAKAENRILKSNEIDGVAKLTASISKIESLATLETYIEVFEEYNKFLMGIDAPFAKANNNYQDTFIQGKIAE